MCERTQTLHWFPPLVFSLWGLCSHSSSGFVVHIATYVPRALYCSGATAPGSSLSSSLPLPFVTICPPLFPPQQKKGYNTARPPPPPQRRHQCPDCAREWQSWTCNTTDEEKGREERRGSVQADKEGWTRGERGGETGQGWPTGHRRQGGQRDQRGRGES
jgi:hypothetical protein